MYCLSLYFISHHACTRILINNWKFWFYQINPNGKECVDQDLPFNRGAPIDGRRESENKKEKKEKNCGFIYLFIYIHFIQPLCEAIYYLQANNRNND